MALLFRYLTVGEVLWLCCSDIYPSEKFSGSVGQVFIGSRSSLALLFVYL